MTSNVAASEYGPRVAIALASAVGAALAPTTLLKALLAGAAGGMLLTVATGYCPVNDVLSGGEGTEPPQWRTIKTHRVEA